MEPRAGTESDIREVREVPPEVESPASSVTLASARLLHMSITGFRNLAPLDLTPGARFNVIHGDNGAGKSNLLEAIAYLASLRSFRMASKDQLITRETGQARIDARLQSLEPLPRHYRILLDRQKARRVTADGKRPPSLGSYFQGIRLVLFHPGDAELAAGPPEPRREQMDRMLEQLDPGYCARLAEYGRALRSRNRLLKDPEVDRHGLAAYDELIASHGARIGTLRAHLVERLAPRLEAHFAEITDQALPLKVRYACKVEPEAGSLLRALRSRWKQDRARGYTTVGPHTDDLQLSVRDHLARHHASQGQHRAMVLALKVAELSLLGEQARCAPLLLLDDVSSELDRARNRRFFTLLSRVGGQVFLTTTHPEFILLEEGRVDWEMKEGALQRCG